MGRSELSSEPGAAGSPRPGPVVPTGAAGVVREALAEVVGSLPAGLRRVAEYHMALGPSACGEGSGGKGVRSALVFVCARAAGGSEESSEAVAGAVAMELVHGFSLLHDDIMDGDRLRRHRKAAWVEFGMPAALLTGDALLSRAVREVERSGSPRAVPVLLEALEGLMSGQSMDLDFERCDQVPLEDYRVMAEGKTGALIGAACALGAVLSGAPESTVAALERFGRCAGIAYQCVDDVLGLWGDPQRTGKPVGSDVIRGKKTYPLAAALGAGGATADRVRALYTRPGPWSADRVAELLEAVEEAGGRAVAEEEAATQLRHAVRYLEQASLPASSQAQLLALTNGMIHRHR